MQTETLTQDILSAEQEINLVQASTGKRFANYLIDLVVFYLLFLVVGVVLAIINPEAVDSIANEDSSVGTKLLDRLLTLILIGIYIGITEALLKGKTVGKYITGTRAVYEYDGQSISAATAFKRGLCRMVPFEAFSALGSPSYPWHDKWTGTIVIDKKQSTTL